jgi:hypothetical protein
MATTAAEKRSEMDKWMIALDPKMAAVFDRDFDAEEKLRQAHPDQRAAVDAAEDALVERAKDTAMATISAIPKERFSTPEATGTPAPKPPSAAEKAKAVAAHALELVKDALDSYRETQTGASMSGFARDLKDPGPKVQELTKTATKGAGDATALLKQGDVVRAGKAAEAAEEAARQAIQLATDYAVALDHSSLTQQTQYTGTPWGPLVLPLEESTQIDNFIVPLTKANEFEKVALREFQARWSEQEKAVAPLIAYLTAPQKASDEILKFASEKAVEWAEQSSTSRLLKEFFGHYKKTLGLLLASAKDKLLSAQMQLSKINLQELAAEKREAAEQASKIIDTIVDVVVGGIKIAIGGVEEVPGVAADIVGGLIKTFKASNLLDEAKALETQAGKLERESINLDIASAIQFIAEVDDQLTTLAPLGGESVDDAQRKVIRAANQFDKDVEKDPRGKSSKFRFFLLTKAQAAAKGAVEAADSRVRNWMGNDVLREDLVKFLEKNNYWFQDNGKTVADAQRDIRTHLTECQAKLEEVKQIGQRLDLLFNAAAEALAKARQ